MAASTTADFLLNSSRAEQARPAQVLNKRFTRTPAEALALHERKQMLWTAAKITTLTVFLIGSIGAAVALSILNPSALVVFAISFVTGMQIVAELTSWFDRKIEHHSQEKQKYARITEIYQELTEKSERGLEREFDRADVSIWEVRDFDEVEGGLKTLAIGLAHLLYTNETTDTLQKAGRTAQQELESESDPKFKRVNARNVFLYSQAAAISRLHAAYDLHIMLNPFCQKKLSDFGSLADRSIEDVLLDRDYLKEDKMFFFSNSSKDPLTFDELSDASLYRIQERFS